MFILTFLPGHLISQQTTCHSINYGVEDGLPSSEVYEALQDTKGYMWFCTDAGVSRFDGYDFQNYTMTNGLTDNTIFHMYEDFKGRIWFLPYNGRLCYFDNDSIYPYRYNDSLRTYMSKEWIGSILIDSNETMTFTGAKHGIGQISKSGEINYQEYGDDSTVQMHCYRENRKVMIYSLKPNNGSSGAGFLNQMKTVPVYSFLEAKELSMNSFQSKHEPGSFLFGVATYVFFYENGRIDLKRTNHTVTHATQLSNGKIWMAYLNNGVRIYNSIKEVLDPFSRPIKMFENSNVSHIFEDNAGGVWLSLQNGGVSYLPNSNILVDLVEEAPGTNRISALLKTKEHMIYMGTHDSKVYLLSENHPPKLCYENVQSYNGSIYHLTINQDSTGEIQLNPLGYCLTRDGVEWSIDHHRLFATKKGEVIFVIDAAEIKETRFNTVFEDKDGKIWVGGHKGLYLFKNDSLILLKSENNLFRSRVEDVDELDNGTKLIATKGKGLILWQDDSISNLTTSDGLINDIIRDIYVDDENDIWLSTPSGLVFLRKYATGWKARNFTNKNGLPSNEINRVVSVGDLIWVATNKGLARFRKNSLSKNNTPPALYFNRISVGEKEVGSNHSFPYNQNNLEIEFIGLSYRTPGKLMYRYQLQGIDANWITGESRIARYPSLPPGEYLFRVQVANEDGVWSDVKEFRFKIEPPFWKTWWFTLLWLIAVIVLIVFIFKYRERKQHEKKERERLMEKQKMLVLKSELKALRSQMNPHFIFNTLSAIKTAVNNSDTVKASEYIVDFSRLIRKVLDNSKQQTIRIEDEIETLRLYIELEQLRFPGRFSYKIKVDKNLDADFQEIPSMVLQPYVENAIIHGLAPKEKEGRLVVEISHSDQHVYCRIEDNGIGRKKAEKIKKHKEFTHNAMGMDITNERIKLYSAEINKMFSVKITDLEDAEGNPSGTLVELMLPT